MRRLHYRLSIAMLAIIAVLGAAFYVVDRYSMRLYHEELSQRLNASLAMYVVNARPLVTDGVVHHETLRELADLAMVINPTAEIYLLGTDGRIVGHAMPPADVLVDRIDPTPVRDLLEQSRVLPIKATDPRNPGTQKVFSAFPVSDSADDSRLAGYLYVVLGGANYDAIAEQVAGSDRQRVIATAFALLVLAAFIAGVLLFSFLTRRLRRLTHEVSAFTTGHFEGDELLEPAGQPADEIDQLRNACQFMAATIRRQLQSLREDDRLRRELVSNISHDLRTPLASMQGYIETLIIKDDSLDATTRQNYLGIARKHAAHLARLIQDLFELAMLEADKVSPEPEHFSLTELVQDVAQEFDLRARDRGVSLKIAPPIESVSVYADISLIQRVLENLVGNAIKYTPAGGSVTIALRRGADGVGVAVSDTGPGIAAQDLPHIFDRFYRGDPDDGRGPTSMGLGLAIAKRILELHDSRITVTSEQSRGTCFAFALPIVDEAA